MNKAELEKKHIAELHTLAAEAGVERYRMLPRAELIAKLADGDGGAAASESPKRGRESGSGSGGERAEGERPARRRRSRSRRPAGEGGGAEREPRAERESRGEREPRAEREPRRERQRQSESEQAPEPESTPEPEQPAPAAASAASESSSRPRRRRRRRFGRRGKGELTLQSLLLAPTGRQALLTADSREAATALLRGIAADLSGDSKGPDPVALLVDPSPEELADWRRDAPQAEIVAAGQPRHASDALAQAQTRANGGEEVILLVDSLTRLAEAYEDADAAKEFFDAAGGNLTVVAALERPAS
jgi:hypothetical protein